MSGIDGGGRFDHEIGEVGGIEGHEGEREAVDQPICPRRQVRKGERASVDLVPVVLAAGIHGLHRTFDQGPESGFFVADFGLRDQRRETIGFLADGRVRRQLPNALALDEVEVVAAEHLSVRPRFPVAGAETGGSPEDETIPGAEDRQEIVVVTLKQISVMKRVLALAGGGLVEILADPLLFVDNAGARLDPEAYLVCSPLPNQE